MAGVDQELAAIAAGTAVAARPAYGNVAFSSR